MQQNQLFSVLQFGTTIVLLDRSALYLLLAKPIQIQNPHLSYGMWQGARLRPIWNRYETETNCYLSCVGTLYTPAAWNTHPRSNFSTALPKSPHLSYSKVTIHLRFSFLERSLQTDIKPIQNSKWKLTLPGFLGGSSQTCFNKFQIWDSG